MPPIVQGSRELVGGLKFDGAPGGLAYISVKVEG